MGCSCKPYAKAGPNSWAVQLSDTVCYPEGGGQPADRGLLRTGSREARLAVLWPAGRTGQALSLLCLCAQIAVLDVQHTPGGVVHVVNSSEPVPEGTTLQVELDWARRLDHMQMHSGQWCPCRPVDLQ